MLSSLGLLLGTEAQTMLHNGMDFAFHVLLVSAIMYGLLGCFWVQRLPL